jgi:glutathione S-transferase
MGKHHIEPCVQYDVTVAGLRAAIDENIQSATEPAIRTLNTALTHEPRLIGEHFTVGDINVAGVLSPSRAKKIDLRHYAHVCEWLERCYSRPAAVRIRRSFPD